MAQHTFIENVHRNTEDWLATKAAVRAKGVDCPDSTPTAQVAGKIALIETGYSGNTVAELIWGKRLKSGGQYPLFEIPRYTEYIGQCVGEYAFAGQTEIEEIVIPDCIYTVANCAFKGCTNLRKITIKAGNTIKLKVSQEAFDTGNATDKLVLLCEGTGSIYLEGMSFMYNGIKEITNLVIGSDKVSFNEFAFNINKTTPSSIRPPIISNIYYHGDENAWDSYVNSDRVPSEIRSGFTNATIHYNYTGDGSEL